MIIPEIHNVTTHFVIYTLAGFIAVLLLIFMRTTYEKDSVVIKLKWYTPLTLSIVLIGGYFSLMLVLTEFSGNTHGWERTKRLLPSSK